MPKLITPNNLNFIALDVETANADMASICQIGIAKFLDGNIIDEWSTLIDPEDYFDSINIEIHGITENDVKGAPTFPEVHDIIGNYLNNNVCVCHTHFDRVSINQALEIHDLNTFNVTWIDSARVARRTWKDCAWRGYGLKSVCKLIGYDFRHHDALEDAKACGQILIEACHNTGLNISDWLIRVEQPIDPERSSTGSAIKREGNPDGELFGEVIVFTGSLEVPRIEAADIAANMGCKVRNSVTKKTSILVVGDQDLSKLNGKLKSSKHIKAEQLINKGHSIKILKESDFLELVNCAPEIT